MRSIKSFIQVPSWNNDFYNEVEFAPPQVREFYFYLVEEISKGNFIDIEGETYYIELYLRSVTEQFISSKNINYLLKRFEEISQAYGNHNVIANKILSWKADAYLYLDDYDKAWFFMRQRRISIKDIIGIRAKCIETFIDGKDFISTIVDYKKGLTKFGKNNLESILEIVSINLNSFHKRHGKNLVENFRQQFNFAALEDKDFLKLREFFDDEKEFAFLKKTYEVREKEYYLDKKKYDYYFQRRLFGDISYAPHIYCEAVPSIILKAIENEFKRLIRECENTFREERCIPRIGEGWIAETELFYKLRDYFSGEKIVNHARPAWLALQHLDIYFPERNIGIEYQGLQHQKPVEYFGGQKTFEKQKERDERKRNLCKANDCVLIYVYEGYNFEELTNKIKFLFASKIHE